MGPFEDAVHAKVSARKEGFVPKKKTWRRADFRSKPLINKRQRFPMEPAITIGGFVKDFKGQPVADAEVHIDMTIYDYDLVDCVVKTDARGQWRFDSAPSRIAKMKIHLVHADHATTGHEVKDGPADKALKELTAVLTINRGASVSGRVANESGETIAGASVYVMGAPGRRVPTKCHTDGTYTLRGVGLGDARIVAQGPDYAPQLREVLVRIPSEPVDFALQRGGTLRGQVFDSKGEAASGVRIGAYVRHKIWEGKTRTDEEGRFVLHGVPPDGVRCNVDGIAEYGPARTRRLKPAGDEVYAIALRPKGSRDKRPVAEVTLGRPEPTARARRGRPSPRKTGLAPASRVTTVRISKVYPFLSAMPSPTPMPGPPPTPGPAPTPAPAIVTSVVLQPDGLPAAGAAVYLSGARVNFTPGGKLLKEHPRAVARAGADGRFRFQVAENVREPVWSIDVVHAAGFSSIELSILRVVGETPLTPWARLEGLARKGKRPLPNAQVVVGQDNGVGYFVETTQVATDAEGTYVFEQLRPATYRVGLTTRGNRSTPTGGSTVKLRPGRTVRVELGGLGRPVIGRLVPTGGEPWLAEWSETNSWLHLAKPRPDGDAEADAPRRQFTHWDALGCGRAMGRVYRGRRARRLDIAVAPDGRFRIDDVEAGSYVATIYGGEPLFMLSGRKSERPNFRNGLVLCEFRVPEMPGGRSDEPLDLGDVPIEFREVAAPGQPAPPLTFKSIDGEVLSLSEYRGKFVLLQLGPVASTDYCKRMEGVYDDFEKDNVFAMVHVHTRCGVKEIEAHIKADSPKAIQGYVGGGAAEMLARLYPSSGRRGVCLIGPDGKILDMELHGILAIKPKVSKALAEHAAKDGNQ